MDEPAPEAHAKGVPAHAPGGRVRPIPVRPAVREEDAASPLRAEDSPQPSAEGGDKGERPSRPPEVHDRPATAPRAAPVLPEPAAEAAPQRFSTNGREWVARAAGRGVAGRGPAAGAPLLLLTFARGENPEVPVLELLTIGRDASSLSPEELAGLLERARPFASEVRRLPLFSESGTGRKADL